MESVGVAIIAKNEEEMIGRCLQSVSEADEIVVVDTGSTDRTIEMAQAYTDKVFSDFTWCDNFAAARNHVKSKLSTDWLLSIDCDEELIVPFQNVRDAIDQAERAVNVKLIAKDNQQSNIFPRLFRNLPDITWRGAVHNYPSVLGEDAGDVQIMYDYSPAHLQDPDRAMRILEKECQDKTKIRELFYLGREYFHRRKFEESIKALESYVTNSNFQGEKAEAYLVISKSHYLLKNIEAARMTCFHALAINANFREACLWMAVLAGEGIGNPRWQGNADQWKRLAETADNRDVLFTRPVGL